MPSTQTEPEGEASAKASHRFKETSKLGIEEIRSGFGGGGDGRPGDRAGIRVLNVKADPADSGELHLECPHCPWRRSAAYGANKGALLWLFIEWIDHYVGHCIERSYPYRAPIDDAPITDRPPGVLADDGTGVGIR